MNQIDTTHVFDGKAETYAHNRLDHSPLAIQAIIAVAGLCKTSAIADLGAGTGMLTRHFVDHVGHVFAIEPNDDMRTLALSRLGRLESLHLIRGTADDTGLPDQSVDAVIAGRALRWFDPAASQAEIRRILRPGGWLIALRTPVKIFDDDAVDGALRVEYATELRMKQVVPPAALPHSSPCL